MYAIINEIDGAAYHTINEGPLDVVRRNTTKAIGELLDRVANGGKIDGTIVTDDGEEHTVRVIVK